jgi:hypothetical protein
MSCREEGGGLAVSLEKIQEKPCQKTLPASPESEAAAHISNVE